jgi:uncharacterized protein (DUF1330 family)
MSAFIIVQINVTNKELYKEYLEVVTPTVKNYGGEYLIRGGKYKVLLGEWNYERTVIIKFSTFKIAMDWYNSKEYTPIKKIREDNSKGNAIIIEGN